MYNHYIPQSDGSFRRQAVSDQSNRRSQRHAPAPPPPPPQPKQPEPPPAPQEPCEQFSHESKHVPPPPHESSQSPLSFLKKLLPKELDSWDMAVIAFLLLLSGDECDGDISPLLTLALYFLL